MILHALVDDYEVARAAIHGGATLVQLRLKDLPTPQLVEEGRPFRDLCARSSVTFVVNDDVEAAIALGADGVHLGRDDEGIEWARAAGLKPYVVEADLGSKGTWYRVRVGAFKDKAAASRFRTDVEREMRGPAVVMASR